jgi:nicotinate-nucleotide adenylyltransferase
MTLVDQPSTPILAQAKRKVGLYGGAFDPPHLAHIALARHAIRQLSLDELRVLPTGQAWHKDASQTPSAHRLAMVALGFSDWPEIIIDEREIRRAGPSYTVDSLRELCAEHPGVSWFLIIGEDQARSFETWRDWPAILQMAQLVVARRRNPGQPEPIDGGWHNRATQTAIDLAFPMMDISATCIRAACAQHQSISQWVSPGIIDYIHRHNLYSQT